MPYKLGQVILSLKPKFIAADDPEHPFADEPSPNASQKERDDYASMHGKAVWFNDEGEVELFTDELYAVAVQKAGPNPYVSLYSGYEQNWSRYKLFVMVMKFLQMFPTIMLTSTYLSTYSQPTSDANARNQGVLQSLCAAVVMGIFAGASFKAAPFIDNTNDRMDQFSRTFLVVTPLLMLIVAVAPGAGTGIGWLLNILNLVNMLIMGYFTLQNLPMIKKFVKKYTGKLDFGDPHGGPLTFQPKDKAELIPDYNLNDERRRRIWKPFWDNLFQTDPLLANTKVDPDAKEGQPKKRRSTMKGPGDIEIVYPQDRLEETIEKLHHRGKKAFESGVMPISKNDVDIRLKLQSMLEGPDVYCTDQWQTESGKSICKDGHMDSKTCFGRLEIDVYPFAASFYWDDCKDHGKYFPGLTS